MTTTVLEEVDVGRAVDVDVEASSEVLPAEDSVIDEDGIGDLAGEVSCPSTCGGIHLGHFFASSESSGTSTMSLSKY